MVYLFAILLHFFIFFFQSIRLFSLDKDDKNLLFLIDNKKYVKLILDMYWSSIKKGHKHFAKFQQSQLKNLKKTTEK